jgi:hypothetical protein
MLECNRLRFDQDIYKTFANVLRSLVDANTPMLHDQISMTKRPLRRIDDVALKRWALFTVE